MSYKLLNQMFNEKGLVRIVMKYLKSDEFEDDELFRYEVMTINWLIVFIIPKLRKKFNNWSYYSLNYNPFILCYMLHTKQLDFA